MKKQRGITLIALVVTIVTLIILAGVAINMTLGENGIFEKAKYAKEQYEIAGVREEIELAILEIQSEKASKGEEFSIEAILAELPSKVEGITLEKEGNSLKGSFNGYNFTINESMKLAIEGESVEVAVSTEVKQYLGKDANGKYAVKALLTLNAEDTIDTVKIENTDGTTTTETVANNTYSKELELELDKEYRINIESENGAKTAKKIAISSTTNISNIEQFVAFRDSVNSGLTYEGATINLLSDIDLSNVCYKVDGTTANDVSWGPIGNFTNVFKGTFDGKENKIKNIYINTSNSNQALFGYSEGMIKNLELASGYVKGNENVAGIVGVIKNNNIVNCKNYANINSDGIVIGGIIGKIISDSILVNLENCKNYGKINSNGYKLIGGIVGYVNSSSGDAKVVNCYNYGNITQVSEATNATQIGGIAGFSSRNSNFSNCGNEGNITSGGSAAGITYGNAKKI